MKLGGNTLHFLHTCYVPENILSARVHFICTTASEGRNSDSCFTHEKTEAWILSNSLEVILLANGVVGILTPKSMPLNPTSSDTPLFHLPNSLQIPIVTKDQLQCYVFWNDFPLNCPLPVLGQHGGVLRQNCIRSSA